MFTLIVTFFFLDVWFSICIINNLQHFVITREIH